MPANVRIVFRPDRTRDNFLKSHGGIDPLLFNSDLSFNVRNLTKLARAFDQTSTALAVTRIGQDYFFLGALFYGKSPTVMDPNNGWTGPPRVLNLSIETVGSVVISFGDGVVGRFEKGAFVVANPGPMASKPFVNHILAEISKDSESTKCNDYWFWYRDCLTRLYSYPGNVGSGGTIIWIPSSSLVSDTALSIEGGIQISTDLSGLRLINSAGRATETNAGPGVIGGQQRRLAEYIDMLGRLCCIDGSLTSLTIGLLHAVSGVIFQRENGKGPYLSTQKALRSQASA